MTRMNQFAPAVEIRSRSRVACNWPVTNEFESERTRRTQSGFSRRADGLPAAEKLTLRARTPEDCDRLFTERVNAGEVEGVVALYEEQGRFVQRDGVLATGHSEIRKAIARLVSAGPILRSEVVKVVRAGDDLAVLYNDWSLSAEGRDGGRIERTGKAIEVVRRQADGTWLFAVDDPYGRG